MGVRAKCMEFDKIPPCQNNGVQEIVREKHNTSWTFSAIWGLVRNGQTNTSARCGWNYVKCHKCGNDGAAVQVAQGGGARVGL